MTQNESAAASALLLDHWRKTTRFNGLPGPLRPATRAEGYAIQAHVEAQSKMPLFGWKIAATSAAGQAHIGVDGPLAGRMIAESVIADGGTMPLGNTLMRVAEVEFAFRMARDLPPRAQPYSVDDVLGAVASLHPAIELPDSRYEDFVHAGAPQLIADCACAHRFVLGAETDVDWRALDLVAFAPHASVGERYERMGIGAAVLGDPRLALTWLVNELSAHGITLKAGQIVTTGTCMAPLAIEPGDHVRADFGVLGKVSVLIA